MKTPYTMIATAYPDGQVEGDARHLTTVLAEGPTRIG